MTNLLSPLLTLPPPSHTSKKEKNKNNNLPVNFHSDVIPYSHLKPPIHTQKQFSLGGSQTYSFLLCGFSLPPPTPFQPPKLGKQEAPALAGRACSYAS